MDLARWRGSGDCGGGSSRGRQRAKSRPPQMLDFARYDRVRVEGLLVSIDDLAGLRLHKKCGVEKHGFHALDHLEKPGHDLAPLRI